MFLNVVQKIRTIALSLGHVSVLMMFVFKYILKIVIEALRNHVVIR